MSLYKHSFFLLPAILHLCNSFCNTTNNSTTPEWLAERLTWETNTWPWSSGRCALWAPLGWHTSRRPHPVKHKEPSSWLSQRHGNVCSVIRNNVYTDIKRENEQRRCGGTRDGGKTKKMFDKIKQNHSWIIREMSLLLNFSVWQLSYIKVLSVTHRLLHRRLLSFSHSPELSVSLHCF